jgi:group I intron endonuclease
MKIGIYMIQNINTKLVYIGKSKNIDGRFSHHKSCLRNSVHKRGGTSKVLHNSFKEHGESAFQFVPLEYCNPENLGEREQYWIDEFRLSHKYPVANAEGPAYNPWKGQKHSPENIAKMSAHSAAMPRGPEWRSAIGNANRGRVASEETRKKISLAKAGKKMPSICGDKNPSKRPGHIKRMSGEKNPAKRPEVRKKIGDAIRKSVIDKNSGEVWLSLSECAVYLGVSVAAVSACISGKNKTCKGRNLEFTNHITTREPA